MKFLKLFRKNKDGVTAIEFAILAPVFFLLFLGIIEVGLTMFVDSSLNLAIREVARKSITKQLTITERDEIFAKHLGGLYNPSKIEYVSSVIDYNETSPRQELINLENTTKAFLRDPNQFFVNNDFNTSDDQSGKIVLYFTRYEWGGFSDLVGAFLPDYLYSVTVIRAEEYS